MLKLSKRQLVAFTRFTRRSCTMTIVLENICKSINGRNVLNNFNISIEWDRIYVFVGPEGCGNSEVLKIFMEMDQPDSGHVKKMGDYKYPTLHSAYVPHDCCLNLNKNAIWNVKVVHKWIGKSGVIEKLSKLIPAEKIKLPTAELTEAERRAVEIVKASFVPADFIVLDHPFRGMDEAQRKAAIDFLLDMRGSRPLLIATDDATDLEIDRVVKM